MPKYQTRPVPIEAVQYFPSTVSELERFVPKALLRVGISFAPEGIGCVSNERLRHGISLAGLVNGDGIDIIAPGDWVVKSFGGRFRIYDADTFAENFEEVIESKNVEF